MIKLEKIAITGYKGISTRTEIPANNFNVIVGKNDAGKSTILKALDLFLNNKQYLAENLNNRTHQFSEIELFFSTNHTEIIVDENVTTTFEDEGLVNSSGLLHIVKKWDGTKTGKISPEYLITRKSFGELDFFSLTETRLIRLCRDNDLEAEPGLMTNPDTGVEHNNAEKRQRLKEIYEERNIDFEYIQEKLPTTGQSRLKKTELEIKRCLPQYEYFLADSPLSESDSSIQKYFKEMAFGVIKDQVDTDALEETVREQLQVVLTVITEKINSVVSDDEQVRARVDFDWSKLISTSFESEGDQGSVPLSARGDGFRRITMMSYFEYLAEERSGENQNIIFAFEEPETFLHPSAQENLFEKLMDISDAGYQVFLTTHSPVLVSQTRRSDLHHVFKDNGSYGYNSEVSNHAEIADDLGVTIDNQFISMFDNARCLLLLEGVDDCTAFEHIANTYLANNAIDRTLEDMGVVSIPIGGCDSIKHWVSLDLLQTLNKPFFIYLDSDKEQEEDVSPNAQKLVTHGFLEEENFLVSRKRELENYIAPSALERLVPGCGVNFTDWCDVKYISKTHARQVSLGGKRIANKHFSSLTFDELTSAYNPTENDDEFLKVYGKLSELVGEA